MSSPTFCSKLWNVLFSCRSREILNYATPPSPGVFFCFFFFFSFLSPFSIEPPSHVISYPLLLMKEFFVFFEKSRQILSAEKRNLEHSDLSDGYISPKNGGKWAGFVRVVMWSTNCPVSFLLFISSISGQRSDHCFTFFFYGNRFLILCNFSSLILIYARWVYFCIK